MLKSFSQNNSTIDTSAKETGAKKKLPTTRLAPYYLGVISTTISIIIVFILNFSTPLEFIQNRIVGPDEVITFNGFLQFFIPRIAVILSIAYLSILIGTWQLLKPISHCLNIYKKDKIPSGEEVLNAQRRLLNLSFLFFPVNIIIWILLPIIVSMGGILTGMIDYHTALILSVRASMVGLIASAIASQRIESISRTALIPFFFPRGQLGRLDGVSKITLSKRIIVISRLCAVTPILILFVTLLTLQWQLAVEPISASEYGRGVIVFTLVLFAWTLIFSKELSRMHSKNIVDPINSMVEVLRNVRKGNYDQYLQVVSNDEIGYAGDMVNEMTKGLQEREKMLQSLNLARQIQQNLLPKENPEIPGLDIAGTSIYCDDTGGDYYDFLMPEKEDNPSVRIVLGDVSGHGISSALLMTTARAFFRQRSSMPGDLCDVVTQVNSLLCKDVEDSGIFMTLCCVEINPVHNQIKWVRAGHDPAILYDSCEDRFKELKGPGVALGVDDSIIYVENQVARVCKGDIVVLFTDGIWEARNSTGERFGKENLRKLIRRHKDLSARELLTVLMDASTKFQDDVMREDDATLIIVKFLNDPKGEL
jgi:sigma-B regulation protein RsbU (phosphoserine phosphatase)